MIGSLYEQYRKLYNSPQLWCISSTFPTKRWKFNTLFERDNAYKFLEEYFGYLGKERIFNCLKDHNVELSRLNANHTLSMLFLGILAQRKLGIEKIYLPLLYSDGIKKEFLYFWTVTCICHDIAHEIEEKSRPSSKGNREIKRIKTIQDFCDQFNISDRGKELLDSDKGQLIENYFLYRLKTATGNDAKIDHGTAGAILLYDAMITEFELAKNANAPNESGPWIYRNLLFRSDFKERVQFIAETIAMHNMWLPTTAEKRNIYRRYHLDTLIDRDPISYNTAGNGFLFLLGLIDTIEPVKCTKKASGRDVEVMLKSLQYIFLTGDAKYIMIESPDCPEYLTSCWNRIRGNDSWLNITALPNITGIQIALNSIGKQ